MENKSVLNKIEVELTAIETMMIAEAFRILNRPDFYKIHFSERMTTFEEEFRSGLKKMNSELKRVGFLADDNDDELPKLRRP
jgi:hypothetical protein